MSDLLTDKQVEVVKLMIVDSMKGIYIDSGDIPPLSFFIAAEEISNKIIANVQMSLGQKTIKKVTKVKKNARK